MILDFKNQEIEATPKNAAIFTGRTLLNGMYVDMDTDYLFLPADEQVITTYPEVKKQAIEEGIPVYEIITYDPEEAPFCFVINALCRVFRHEIDYELRDKTDE